MYDTQLELIYSNYASEVLDIDYWIVNRQFICCLNSNEKQFVTIPKGFLTDGATVPRILWSIFPKWGKYGQAACVHDFLCEYLIISENGRISRIERSECDYFFYTLMTEMGIPKWKRLLMYWGVSLFRVFGKIKDPSVTSKKADIETYLLDHNEKNNVWL